jgi:hypothetical protein
VSLPFSAVPPCLALRNQPRPRKRPSAPALRGADTLGHAPAADERTSDTNEEQTKSHPAEALGRQVLVLPKEDEPTQHRGCGDAPVLDGQQSRGGQV